MFAAIRDDSDEATQARQEPLTALVWLAGMAAVPAAPALNDVLDDPARDGLVVAIIVFFAGGLYGLTGYWLLGGILHLSARALGSQGTYRRARHVAGFASAPVALALFLYWPFRIAIVGGDLFRAGGSDGGHVFADAFYAFVAWFAVLVAIGVRTVHGWSWPRALATVAVTTAVAALLALAALFLR